MRFSVYNFKSIERLESFELKPFNLLAGVNSSGKSSLIQALLLLKQTLCGKDALLSLDGPYVWARSISDLAYRRSKRGFSFQMSFSPEELGTSSSDFKEYMRDSDTLSSITLILEFKDRQPCVSEFELHLQGKKNSYFRLHRNEIDAGFVFSTNMPIFLAHFSEYINPSSKVIRRLKVEDVDFINFFPIFATFESEDRQLEYSFLILKDLRQALIHYLDKISYIAPVRVSPQLDLPLRTGIRYDGVDMDGANTRYILAEKKYTMVDSEHTLGEAVSYWICDKLHLAQSIDSSRNKDTNLYRTTLNVHNNLPVDLIQTGFGNSQILPIIVQGLLMPRDGLLIVEDPEVHMHPSVQADMVDFFLYLVSQGKRVMVETHSDHVITRLRRRIIESSDGIQHLINLYYVVNTDGSSRYIPISFDAQGDFLDEQFLPEGFMDTQDIDYRRIVELKISRSK